MVIVATKRPCPPKRVAHTVGVLRQWLSALPSDIVYIPVQVVFNPMPQTWDVPPYTNSPQKRDYDSHRGAL